MQLDPQQLRTLARITLATRPDEIDCDEWLTLVGAYVEAVARNEPIPEQLSTVGQHLEVCPECAQEFEVLLEIAREGGGAG